jgi:hypothetical protein
MLPEVLTREMTLSFSATVVWYSGAASPLRVQR